VKKWFDRHGGFTADINKQQSRTLGHHESLSERNFLRVGDANNTLSVLSFDMRHWSARIYSLDCRKAGQTV